MVAGLRRPAGGLDHNFQRVLWFNTQVRSLPPLRLRNKKIRSGSSINTPSKLQCKQRVRCTYSYSKTKQCRVVSSCVKETAVSRLRRAGGVPPYAVLPRSCITDLALLDSLGAPPCLHSYT